MSSLNLARIVHRLLTDPRGWRVSDLCAELGIAARTYRKYRKLLQEQFSPFSRQGGARLEEVEEADGRYLRLRGRSPLHQVHSPHDLAVLTSDRLTTPPLRSAYLDGAQRAWPAGRLLTAHVEQNADRLLWALPTQGPSGAVLTDVLSRLFAAMLQRSRVRLRQRDRPAISDALEPLTLASLHGQLYVVLRAPKSGDLRPLPLSLIEEVWELEDRFAYPGPGAYAPEWLFA